MSEKAYEELNQGERDAWDHAYTVAQRLADERYEAELAELRKHHDQLHKQLSDTWQAKSEAEQELQAERDNYTAAAKHLADTQAALRAERDGWEQIEGWSWHKDAHLVKNPNFEPVYRRKPQEEPND